MTLRIFTASNSDRVCQEFIRSPPLVWRIIFFNNVSQNNAFDVHMAQNTRTAAKTGRRLVRT
jgi:hypothetical protein